MKEIGNTFVGDPCLDLRNKVSMVDNRGMRDILQDTQDILDIPYRRHLHCDHWKQKLF